MKNYSSRHINRALDMLLDDLDDIANAGDLRGDSPPTLPAPLPGGENAAAGRETADKRLLDVADVSDDACGDVYLSEGRVYP